MNLFKIQLPTYIHDHLAPGLLAFTSVGFLQHLLYDLLPGGPVLQSKLTDHLTHSLNLYFLS